MSNTWHLYITPTTPTNCVGIPDGTPIVGSIIRYLTYKLNNNEVILFGTELSYCQDPIAHGRDKMIYYLKTTGCDDISKNITVVFIGDSNIAGSGADISTESIEYYWNQLSGTPFINLGVAGETTSQIYSRINDAISNSYNYMVINGGTNDIATNVDNVTILTNWNNSLQAIYNSGLIPVVWLIPSTDPSAWNATKKTNRDYVNNELIKLTDSVSGIVVNMNCILGQYNPSGEIGNCWDTKPQYRSTDGQLVHFNAAAHQIIAQTIYNLAGKPSMPKVYLTDSDTIYVNDVLYTTTETISNGLGILIGVLTMGAFAMMISEGKQ